MPDLQATNRVKISKTREVTFGVIPTSPVFKEMRVTNAPMQATPQTQVTNEIRSDRQITDLILVNIEAGGSAAGELSFLAHDDDIEEAVQGTWASKPSITVVISDTLITDVSATTLTVASALGSQFVAGMLALISGMTTTANNRLARVSSSSATTVVFPAATFTAQAVVNVGTELRAIGFEGASGDLVATITGGNAITSSSLDFTTLPLAVGEWVKIGEGAAGLAFTGTAANNGWARVSAIAAQRLLFDVVPAGWAADAGTGKTLRVFFGDRIRNGSTKRSNAFERQYLDHSPVTYEYLRGKTLNTMGFRFDASAAITISREWMGKDAYLPEPMARVSGATDIAAPTRDVLNTTSNVADIAVDGVTVAGPNFVIQASIDINNNLRRQNAIMSFGAIGIGNGEFSVTGAMQSYFGDPSIYRKVIGNLSSSFALRAGRQDGNRETYLIDVPRIEFTQGTPTISGKNADVMLEGQYQGVMHPTLGYTIHFGRYWYLPAV